MSRRGTPEQKQLVMRIIEDRGLFDLVADDCCANYEATAGLGEYGDWQSFLEWLIDHADEIFAMIARIIDLFAD